MIKLVVFDLDGTLVDTVESIAKTANLALAKLGYPPLPIPNFKYYAGDGVGELLKRVIKDVGGDENRDYETLKEWYFHFFPTYACYHVEIYPYIQSLLKSLSDRGISIGVYTNKPQHIAEQVIEELFDTSQINFIIGQSPGQERKPSPIGIYEMMNSLQISSDQVLYVGDTDTDMQTAQNANVQSVGVLWGFRDRSELEKHGAKYIVERADQILEYI